MIYEIHHDGQTASTEEGATASDEEGGAAGARGEQRAGGDGRRQGQQRGTARQQQQATRRQAAAVQATDDGQGDPGTAPAQRSRASNLQLLSADDRSPGTAGPGRASTSSSSQERTAGCTATRFRCREALPARRTATRYAKRTPNGYASEMCLAYICRRNQQSSRRVVIFPIFYLLLANSYSFLGSNLGGAKIDFWCSWQGPMLTWTWHHSSRRWTRPTPWMPAKLESLYLCLTYLERLGSGNGGSIPTTGLISSRSQ